MSKIILAVDLFRGDEDFKRSRDALLHVLEALTKIDEDYLEAYPQTPTLYASGVVYRRPGPKPWFDVPSTITEGWGDCKDFACWRAAELHLSGESQARPWLKHVVDHDEKGQPFYSFHVVVMRKNQGRRWIEDPSRILGMGIELPTVQEYHQQDNGIGSGITVAERHELAELSPLQRKGY